MTCPTDAARRSRAEMKAFSNAMFDLIEAEHPLTVPHVSCRMVGAGYIAPDTLPRLIAGCIQGHSAYHQPEMTRRVGQADQEPLDRLVDRFSVV